MSAFLITNSGITDQRLVTMAYDGLTFAAPGAATIQLTSAQFSFSQLTNAPNGDPLAITGDGQANTVEIFMTTNGALTMQNKAYLNWSANDTVAMHDTIFNEEMQGSKFNDQFYITGGVDTVEGGGGGDDTLNIDWTSALGGFGMNGGLQFSNFRAGNEATVLNFSFGAAPGFTISLNFNIHMAEVNNGSIGNDNLTLFDGNDSFFSGFGDDTLNMAKGNATVDGGVGTDLWYSDFSNNATAATINLNLTGTRNAGNGSSYANIERVGLTGGSGADVFTTKVGNPDDGLNDTLNSGAGNDTLTVGGGVDVVDGGDGNDLLVVNWAGNVNGFGMNGPSQFADFVNTSVSFSNIERFDVTLGDGNDDITLGTANDTIRGNGGNDILRTGTGGAIVDGGSGIDTWVADLSAQAAAKTIDLRLTGIQAAGGSTTYANLEAMIMATGAGNDLLMTLKAGYNDNLSSGAGNDTLGIGGGLDSVDGGAGSDDLLIIDYSGVSGNVSMNGPTQFSNFNDTRLDFVGIEHFNVTLGAGNDNVTLGAFADTVDGGAGNDTLNTGIGDAVVIGGADNDLWIADQSGDTRAKTINLSLTGPQNASVGTTYDGIERIQISTGIGADSILTLADAGGNDAVSSGDGNDTISFGFGSDTVDGGLGIDTLILNYGNRTGDFVMNGSAQISNFADTRVDFVNIDRFNVTLGVGNDNITLGSLADSINGGGGNDTLNTGTGDAVVVGGTGNDLWIADQSTDTRAKTIDLSLTGTQIASVGTTYNGIERIQISTGSGADSVLTLTDAGGNDAVSSGDGNDTIAFGFGLDTVDGGLGIDTLILHYGNRTGNFQMNGANQISNFGDTRVDFVNIDKFNLTFGAGNDNIILGSLDDTINGGGGNDLLNTLAGLARVDGGAGLDTWLGDLSAATVNLTVNLNLTTGLQTAGGGSFYARLEALNLSTGSGADTLTTLKAAYNDVLSSGAGNDTLTVGGGLDAVNGGADDDLLIIDYSAISGNLVMNGATQFSNFADTRLDFSNIERFNVTLNDNGNTITLLDGADTVTGGAGNDIFNTAIGAAVVNGKGGNDFWVADQSGDAAAKTINLNLAGVQVAGNGTTYAGIEAISILTGAGADSITTFDGVFNDGVATGDGADTVKVFGGLDGVNGGAGNDLLIIDYSGRAGNFVMNGGAQITNFGDTRLDFTGFERIDGSFGAGADNIVFSSGNDTASGGLGNDTLNGAGGSDTMDWRDATGAIIFTLGAVGNGTVTAAGIGTDSFTGFENFWLGSGNDRVVGNADINLLDGGLGNDTLRGGGNNNTLIGGDGKDQLIGGLRRDVMTGGMGADKMTGGGGTNTYVYNSAAETGVVAASRDVITDFVAGTDKIDLRTIDAVAGGADTAFTFHGVTAAFAGAGDIRLEQSGLDTLVHLNLDADAASEAVITLAGVTATSLHATDFLL